MMFDELDDSLRERLTELFNSQIVSVLGTSASDEPYSCLVGFKFTHNLGEVVFATMRNRLKYRQISANPRVSLMVDNRKNTPYDFDTTTSVTVIGDAVDTESPEREKLAKMLVSKNSFLSEFVESPDCAVVKVQIEKMYIVDNFESVTKIEY
ncbi:MAG: pyridoxamine 5'-phosphate oxidase family protein [Candidatus Thorarchaeota archaeon]|jgi:nitroimidazol reductase NimA-like FMN-containing flavoprotein (pyridoxamine 5'-phosphate oxidase superfamily)